MAAIHTFDHTNSEDWLAHPWQRYVLVYEATPNSPKPYPPKHVLSLAADIPRNKFRGGPGEANPVLEQLGFDFISKDEWLARASHD